MSYYLLYFGVVFCVLFVKMDERVTRNIEIIYVNDFYDHDFGNDCYCDECLQYDEHGDVESDVSGDVLGDLLKLEAIDAVNEKNYAYELLLYRSVQKYGSRPRVRDSPPIFRMSHDGGKNGGHHDHRTYHSTQNDFSPREHARQVIMHMLMTVRK